MLRPVTGEALLLESKLAELDSPPVRTFDTLYHISTRYNKASKRREPVLGGHSATLYESENDLVLLRQPVYEDRVTMFVQRYLPILFLVRRGQNC